MKFCLKSTHKPPLCPCWCPKAMLLPGSCWLEWSAQEPWWYLGLCFCQGPCLHPRSYHRQGVCWCPWPMLQLQTMCVKTGGPSERALPFTGPTFYYGCCRADSDGEGPGGLALLLAWGGAFPAEALNDQFSYIQAPIQSFELAHPNIYTIYDLLE